MPWFSSRPVGLAARVTALSGFGVLLAVPADALDCACDTFTSPGPANALNVTYTGATGGVAALVENMATSGHSHGVEARVLSGDGMAVHGYNDATTGWAIGVEGDTASSTGVGVYGYHGGAGAGVGTYGDTYSTTGTGVMGNSGATTGTNYGVYGAARSTSGYGVYGSAGATTGVTTGVYGNTASPQGRGVYGNNSSATGTTYGVSGNVRSSAGRAVYGNAQHATGTVYGVYGTTNSSNGRAVYGTATAASGTTYGVYGAATSATGYALYGSGNFAVTGTKSAIVQSSAGPVEMYAVESPEVWFEDYGEATLQNGRAHVDLDPEFLETVTIDDTLPMKVFIQLEGPSQGVWVEKGLDGFDVVEQGRGTSDVSFSYRVIARRAGYEDRRLRRADVAQDSFLVHP